jgi:hypothetical protein
VTSLYVYQGKLKIEWIHQANGYAALFRANGFPVAKLEDWAILRDWSRAKFRSDPQSYPPVPFQVVNIPLKSNADALAHMVERIAIHESAERATKQEEIEVCNEQERWTKEPTFACIKEGNKKATKVFKPSRDFGGDGPEEIEMARAAAQEFADTKGIDMVSRPGEETRCLSYCPVKKFCRFGRELQT